MRVKIWGIPGTSWNLSCSLYVSQHRDIYQKVAHIVLMEEHHKQIGIWVLSLDQPTDILGFPMTRLGPKLKCPTGGQWGFTALAKKMSDENPAG